MISPSGKIGTVGGLRNYSTNGLLFNVDFSNDYGFSGNTAYDLSVNKAQCSTPGGFVSVVSGSTAMPGYIDLDGVTDYLVAQSALSELSTASQITVDAWVKLDTISVVRTLVANNSTTTSNPGFGIVAALYSGTEYYFRGSVVSSTATALALNTSLVRANTGEWVNGFFNFDYSLSGTTYSAKLYRTAGVSASQDVFASAIPFTSANPIYIGRRATATQYYDGMIGSVKIYNRILSSDEMDFNYNKSKSRYGHT